MILNRKKWFSERKEYFETNLKYSPNGKRIASVTSLKYFICDECKNIGSKLLISDYKGGYQRPLLTGYYDIKDFIWFPSGNKLLVTINNYFAVIDI